MLLLAIFNSIFTRLDFKQIFSFFMFLKNNEEIIIISYIVENSLSGFIFIIIASIILLCIFIWNTPPYQLVKLSDAFKIANFFIVLMSIVIFFYTNIVWSDMDGVINHFKNIDNFHDFVQDPNFNKHLNNFSKKNIINLGYIMLLPYILGIIISNIFIDFLKRKYEKKSLNALDSLTKVIIENKFELERLNNYKREFFFYGGNKTKLGIIERMVWKDKKLD